MKYKNCESFSTTDHNIEVEKSIKFSFCSGKTKLSQAAFVIRVDFLIPGRTPLHFAHVFFFTPL